MGRTESNAPGYEPDDENRFDPSMDDFTSKERKYVHFDYPLSEQERSLIRATDDVIAGHSFWPLLGFKKTERRVRRDPSGTIFFEEKPREIKFGSHRDAALLEAYTRRLSHSYEISLRARGLKNCVLAYRSDIGDNITQAKDLFDLIKSRGDVLAIGLDIRKFFDRLSHSTLKENLLTILRCERLSTADYKIFRRMTKFDWVDVELLESALHRLPTPKGRLCTAKQFRDIVRAQHGLIMQNSDHGIPQGTPLSGLYANICLLEFDTKLSAFVSSLGGVYRRYSDDIAVLVPTFVDPCLLINDIEMRLAKANLTIAENKTIISMFSANEGNQSANKPFQYLGFTFDGDKILIRQSSLNRYYAKMSRGIKAKVRAAKVKGITRDTVFMRELFKRYTHFGKRRNFPRYAYRAAKIMHSDDIRKQVRRHMGIFKDSLRYYLDRAY